MQPHVGAIILQGAGERAFCAGGDVRALCVGPRDEGLQAAAIAYFRAEDTLCWQINQLRKPHVSVIDGIVMGGGAGLSLNGMFRIATERSVFAMPEAAIGFFPDVGASHFLNKLPGRLGVACALTGLRLRGRELRDCGVATHYVESAHLPRLMTRLEGLSAASARMPSALGSALREHESLDMLSQPPAESVLRKLPLINDWFAPTSVEEIEARLAAAAAERHGAHGVSKYAATLLAEMRRASPTALKVSLEALARGAWHVSALPRARLTLLLRSAGPDSARVPAARVPPRGALHGAHLGLLRGRNGCSDPQGREAALEASLSGGGDAGDGGGLLQAAHRCAGAAAGGGQGGDGPRGVPGLRARCWQGGAARPPEPSLS